MKPYFLVASAAFALAVPAAIFASPVISTDALREWNLIVLGDLESSSEVEGRTFVGGDLSGNSSNYMIRDPGVSIKDQPGLTVVGNVTGGTKNLNNGSGAVVGGNVESGFNLNGSPQNVRVGGSIANTNINNNRVQSGLAANDSSFSADLNRQQRLLDSSLHSLSATMADMKTNSTADFSGNRATFNAAPDSNGMAVFNISADKLNSVGEIGFNLNGADTAVVNVSGANIRLDDNFLGGTNGLGEHVIWNFNEAKSLDLSTAWGGSILAPDAAARTGNYIQGSAVFGSLKQNGEMHLGTYTGGYFPPSTPPEGSSGGGGGAVDVPEPGTLGLLLLAIAGLFWRNRRRKAAVTA